MYVVTSLVVNMTLLIIVQMKSRQLQSTNAEYMYVISHNCVNSYKQVHRALISLASTLFTNADYVILAMIKHILYLLFG